MTNLLRLDFLERFGAFGGIFGWWKMVHGLQKRSKRGTGVHVLISTATPPRQSDQFSEFGQADGQGGTQTECEHFGFGWLADDDRILVSDFLDGRISYTH
jgi:hypothetical protein